MGDSTSLFPMYFFVMHMNVLDSYLKGNYCSFLHATIL